MMIYSLYINFQLIDNNNNDDINNDYDKYEEDDILNYKYKNTGNNLKKDKNSKTTKSNVLKESGQNIIYGMKDINMDDELNNINYHELDYDLNEDINNQNNNNTNPKKSKIKSTTTPYERLELLNQLEMENKKETEQLLENMANDQNLSQNLEDI